jgi:hypothetical protein
MLHWFFLYLTVVKNQLTNLKDLKSVYRISHFFLVVYSYQYHSVLRNRFNNYAWLLPIPGRSRRYFGFGPVCRRRWKLFGFRRLQTTILKGLFSYLVYTFGGLRSHHPSKMVRVGSFPRGWGAKNQWTYLVDLVFIL